MTLLQEIISCNCRMGHGQGSVQRAGQFNIWAEKQRRMVAVYQLVMQCPNENCLVQQPGCSQHGFEKPTPHPTPSHPQCLTQALAIPLPEVTTSPRNHPLNLEMTGFRDNQKTATLINMESSYTKLCLILQLFCP